MSLLPGRGKSAQPMQYQCLGCDYGDSVSLRIEKGDKAFSLGEYDLAAEIFRLVMPRVPKPDRDLCLRMGNALARAGHIFEALGAFRGAAWLRALRPEELGHLACGIAHNVRVDEWYLEALQPEDDLSVLYLGRPPTVPRPPTSASLRDLLCCPRCAQLLLKPVTQPCGLTVCLHCVEKGVSQSHAGLVSVVLNNLLKKCFPNEGRVRSLATQARTMQRRQQHEAALVRCEQALALVPGDNSLLLLRAELNLNTKNYEQALQDTSEVCQNEPYFLKAHHMQAQALSGLGRTKEMLKECLYCLALNPEFNSVKVEAQKVLCELLFKNLAQNSAPPTRRRTVSTRSKLKSNSRAKTQSCLAEDCTAGSSKSSSVNRDMFKNTNASVFYHIMSQQCEEDNEIIENILSIKPGTGVKRRFPSELKSVPDVNIPEKIPKKDAASSPQSIMDSEVGKNPGISIAVTDLECSFCMRLLIEPVTTPCGHTFCLKCLDSCLDHAPHCPSCKKLLPELLESRNFQITTLVEELILRYLPDELSKRQKIHNEELFELTKDVPIFVCTMGFPTVSCPLHVFELRYELVVRRCMETGIKRFGMCLPTEDASISEYGCIMEMKGIHTFCNGKSLVEAIGIRRFRVLSYRLKGVFNTAEVEYLADKKVEEGPEYEELITLHDSVYQQSVSWFNSLQGDVRKQIIENFGLMPGKKSEPQSVRDGPAWCWWVLAVWPLENKAKLAILAMTSLKERLLAIQRVLVLATRMMNSPEELADTRKRKK